MIEQAKAAALADVKEKLARLEEIESQLAALQAEHKKTLGERDALADENQRQLSRTNQLLEDKDNVRQTLLDREEEVSGKLLLLEKSKRFKKLSLLHSCVLLSRTYIVLLLIS